MTDHHEGQGEAVFIECECQNVLLSERPKLAKTREIGAGETQDGSKRIVGKGEGLDASVYCGCI